MALILLFLAIFIVALVAVCRSRVCPHCAERIKKAASVCRYCGRDVVESQMPAEWTPPMETINPAKLSTAAAIRKAALIVVVGLGAVFVAVYLTNDPGPKSRLEVSAPPMAATQTTPFVEAPTAAVTNAKAQPKDAKPKAPAAPLRIIPQ